ncbi:unnamed protein product [Caenorhabditis auriculariae]|uniref:Uncharacterized protein n=1 Tax=Caenorhabditis auriculariae TaxID=2777116 RepID=A0A8S1H521_9PELO|nr:unnamed protein product [Caenorhabditis auriculariae]
MKNRICTADVFGSPATRHDVCEACKTELKKSRSTSWLDLGDSNWMTHKPIHTRQHSEDTHRRRPHTVVTQIFGKCAYSEFRSSPSPASPLTG